MRRSRRQFLARGSMGLLGAAVASQVDGQTAAVPQTPGAPTVFGTAPPVGPEVSATTFAEAEKLMQVAMKPADRAQAAGNWQRAMAPVYERRVGPRKLALGDVDVPATVWNPVLPGQKVSNAGAMVADTATFAAEFPKRDEDIAFAPVAWLSAWISGKKLTSERLTKIYVARLKKYQPKLNCVITLTEEHALKQARAADAEMAAGKYRGPLHGIPWGAKDLLDTAGIATTWGAEPFRDRVPVDDATVTKRLNDAGAVLVAKLSLGSLALNDVWFGGQTMNPWLLEEGASGSSAGRERRWRRGWLGLRLGARRRGRLFRRACDAASQGCGRRLGVCRGRGR